MGTFLELDLWVCTHSREFLSINLLVGGSRGVVTSKNISGHLDFKLRALRSQDFDKNSIGNISRLEFHNHGWC